MRERIDQERNRLIAWLEGHQLPVSSRIDREATADALMMDFIAPLLAELAALRARDRENGARADQPSPGLLMSMAIRYDHALGMPGYRDWKLMPGLGEKEDGLHARILANTMGTMRQLWEEITGVGFYNPAREVAYVASARACGVSFDENGRPSALPLTAQTEDGDA